MAKSAVRGPFVVGTAQTLGAEFLIKIPLGNNLALTLRPFWTRIPKGTGPVRNIPLDIMNTYEHI